MPEQLIMDKDALMNCLPRIAGERLGYPVTNLKHLGRGSYGTVFRAQKGDGEFIVLKAYRVPGMNETEAFQLQLLSENTHVKMPEVLFVHSDENLSVMCMSYIHGSNVLNPSYYFKNAGKRRKFANDVISGMLEWHEVRGEKYGDVTKPEYDSWHACYRENKVTATLAGLEKLAKENKFSPKRYELLCRATEKFDALFEEPECPALVHGDLNIMNIMADPKTFELNGFIDPCGTMWADREYDLFQLQNMWGNRFKLYETYKALHKTSKNCDFKVTYYGAINETSCRLGGGLIFPLWEDLWINRLKKQMDK